MTSNRLAMLMPRGFWEWVLVLFVLCSALLIVVVPLAMLILFAIYGYHG